MDLFPIVFEKRKIKNRMLIKDLYSKTKHNK